jgi:hypothetical protein
VFQHNPSFPQHTPIPEATPPEIQPIIESCFAFNPTQRTTAQQCYQALAALCHERHIAIDEEDTPSPPQPTSLSDRARGAWSPQGDDDSEAEDEVRL